jgi:YD repeat-containing protein
VTAGVAQGLLHYNDSGQIVERWRYDQGRLVEELAYDRHARLERRCEVGTTKETSGGRSWSAPRPAS